MLNMYADQAHLVKKQPAKAKQPATTQTRVIFYLKNSKKDTCTEYRAAERYGAHTVHS